MYKMWQQNTMLFRNMPWGKSSVLAEVILSYVHEHENRHNNLEFEYELRATDKDQ